MFLNELGLRLDEYTDGAVTLVTLVDQYVAAPLRPENDIEDVQGIAKDRLNH